MEEKYEIIFGKIGKLIKESHEISSMKYELSEIYSINGEIENFLEKYLENTLTDQSTLNLEKNLEDHINATFNYYDSLVEKRSFLKIFGELIPKSVFQEHSPNLNILFEDLDEEIYKVRNSLSLATTDSLLLDLLKNKYNP